jgi:AcrR family transcriptional regulator
MIMPRPPRPLDARAAERLRDAAAAAFGAKGLEDASLNEILGAAAMGKGSFYHWFADKAALHDWVVDGMVEQLRAELRVPAPSALTAASFRPELDAVLARFMRAAEADARLANLGLMFHNSADAPAERSIARVRAAALHGIDDVLRVGRERGAVRDDLPSDLLSAWAISSLTTLDQWALRAHGPARAAVAATALDALWSLLAPPAEESRP